MEGTTYEEHSNPRAREHPVGSPRLGRTGPRGNASVEVADCQVSAVSCVRRPSVAEWPVVCNSHRITRNRAASQMRGNERRYRQEPVQCFGWSMGCQSDGPKIIAAHVSFLGSRQRAFPPRGPRETRSRDRRRQGFRLSTSVGGVLTGRGADFIIIDDPLKPDEAVSDTQRKAVNDWYDHTLLSRLNNKRDGCIILIMQRLNEDDLGGPCSW